MNFKIFSQVNLKQKLSRRERAFFLITLFFILFIFIKSYVLGSHQALSTLKQQLGGLTTERNELAQMANQAKQVQQSSITHKNEKWVGSRADINHSLDQLAKSTALKGVKILKVKFSDSKKMEGLIQKGVSLTLKGSFIAIGNYIEILESLPAPLVIESFSMTADSDNFNHITTEIAGGFYGAE